MTRKDRVVATLALLAVTLVAGGCGASPSRGSESAPSSAKPITAKFALFTGATSPQTLAANRLGELVNKATNGRVSIKTFPLGELGSTRTVLTGLETGSVQMTVTGGVASLVPQFEALYLPYLFPSEEVAMKVANGPAGQEIWDHFSKHNMHVIGVWPYGYAHFLTDKKITDASSLHGLKLRVFDAPMGDLTDRALGANPTPMAVNQVFTALQTHAIDGMDDPISSLVSGHDYEAAHYLAITGHLFVFGPVLVSNSFWQQLSPSEQQSVITAERAVEPYEWQLAQKEEQTGLETMQKAGVVITHPDVQAFRAATQPVYKETESITGAKIIQDVLQAVQAASK